MSHFKAEMHQIRFRMGLRPRPRWRSSQRSPDPLVGLKGPYFREGRGRGKKGRRGEREGEGKEGEGEGRDEEGKGGEGRDGTSPAWSSRPWQHWLHYMYFTSGDALVVIVSDHHNGVSFCRCLVCVIVYLVGGILLLRYWRGARGVEQIPNYEFWKSLPGLVKVCLTLSTMYTVSGKKRPP